MANAKVSIIHDSLTFEAHRSEGGIEIDAEFQAPQASNPDEGLREYAVRLTIDPLPPHGVSGRYWFVDRQGRRVAYEGPKDRLRWWETQIRDDVLATPAWADLVQRGPDPKYKVDHFGREVPRDPPMRRS